jgi:hypothetical protein
MVDFQPPTSVIGIPSHLAKSEEYGFSLFFELWLSKTTVSYFFRIVLLVLTSGLFFSRYLLCSSIQERIKEKFFKDAGEAEEKTSVNFVV